MKLDQLSKIITPGSDNGLFELKVSELQLLFERTGFTEETIKDTRLPHYLPGFKRYVFHFDDYIFDNDSRIEIGKSAYIVYGVTREKIILLHTEEKI
ncbi:hypothetical protein [Chryseobacterium bernardetii]|uniref:hypothetical protein n=1 Tax=Chryseobacterium bernardetii TaxID=1241978 RepID=UPI003AF8F3FF